MTTVDERTDAYFDSLSAALSARLKEAKGNTTYADLEEKTGKRTSTMSGHLQPGANLTLRTIAQYEVALDQTVYAVPLDAPKASGRRRRSRPEGGWTAENESRDADPVETRLYRVLTRLSRRIIQLIQSREDWDQQRLADKAGMQASHLSRLIGGGVNPTLQTIAALEAALGTHLLEVDGREQSESAVHVEGRAHRIPSRPYEKNSQFVQLASSSDGGFCLDLAGEVSRAMDYYASRDNRVENVEDYPVAA